MNKTILVVALLSTSSLLSTGAGVLPYTFNQYGERIYLIGWQPHKKSFSDFGGGAEKCDNENLYYTACREFHEETFNTFINQNVDTQTYLHRIYKAGNQYRMYFSKVHWTDADKLTQIRRNMKKAPRGAEPTRFIWIPEHELEQALIYANQNNTNYGIVIKHTARDGQKYDLALHSAFVSLLRFGTDIHGNIGFGSLKYTLKEPASSSSASSSSTQTIHCK